MAKKKKKKKAEPEKPLTWRERRAAARKQRKKKEAKAAKKRSENRAARTERVVGEASEPLRGGKDGARLFNVDPDEGKLNDWHKIKTPKEKADAARRKNAEWGRQVGQGQVQADAVNEKIANEKASRRAAQSANEQAAMRAREDYRKSAARKNTREYKRGQHLLKDPGRKERLAEFKDRSRRAAMGRAQAKRAPQGPTRNQYGTSFESKKQRATRKGQATKTRRNAMRKKYAGPPPKQPSPVSKTAKQRARDINTMNRSEPKRTGNIYADKDLAREKKRISSKPTYRPPSGASNEEYKRVAKKAMAKKYGDNNAFVKKLGRGLSKFGRRIPVAGAVVSAAVGADPLEAFPGVVGKAGSSSTKKPKWKKPPGSRYSKPSRRSRPKPSTRPARNKPKPKKYNRKDTWG